MNPVNASAPVAAAVSAVGGFNTNELMLVVAMFVSFAIGFFSGQQR
ncbi:hypothetical protein [Chromobacterium amazonense]|nr:hypothetical protein [Chromobacterium amazonense]